MEDFVLFSVETRKEVMTLIRVKIDLDQFLLGARDALLPVLPRTGVCKHKRREGISEPTGGKSISGCGVLKKRLGLQNNHVFFLDFNQPFGAKFTQQAYHRLDARTDGLS